MAYIPVTNQSVSGTVGASVIGNVNTTVTSVATVGGFLNVNLVGGSILTSSTPNQSVSGTVVISQLAGSILATSATVTLAANQSVSGAITAPAGSVISTANPAGSITAVAIVSGSVAVATGNSSVMLLNSTNTIGSVTVLQGTNPWVMTGSVQGSFSPSGNQSVSGTVLVNNGSVVAFQGTSPWIVTGSVQATVNTGNSSVTLLNGTNVIGSVMALQGTNPWVTVGSVQGTMSVLGTVPVTQSTSPWIVAPNNSSMFALQVAGSVMATSATVSMSNSSVMLLNSANVIGSVSALQGTNPWIITNIAGSVMSVTIPAGSITAVSAIQPAGSIMAVTATQGTSPWVVAPNNSSLFALQVAGSTMAVSNTQAGTVITSIAGGYATGAASIVSGLGVLVQGVRNDTMATVGATSDGFYGPLTIGPVGENIVANAPINKWVQGTADLRVVQGASVTALAAQGTSIFTYITGVQVANMGPSSVLVTLGGGLGSILGYTIAPIGGGSNVYYANALKTGANSAFTASISGVASVLVTVQGFISKT